MTRALALRLLHWYPLAWRERYEAEVSALVEDSDLYARDLAELLRGLVTERARELMFSTEHAGRTLFILGAVKAGLAVGIVGLAFGTGNAARTWIDPVSDTVVQIVCGVAALFLIVTLLWTMLRGFSIRRTTPHFKFPAWVGVAFVAGVFVMVSAMTAIGILDPYDTSEHRGPGLSHVYPYLPLLNHVMYTLWAMELSSFWPGRQLLIAFGELSQARAAIKLSEQWVAGCHQMIAAGVPSPLNDALAQLASSVRLLDDAQQQIDALGYRARFQPHRHSGTPA